MLGDDRAVDQVRLFGVRYVVVDLNVRKLGIDGLVRVILDGALLAVDRLGETGADGWLGVYCDEVS